MEFKLVFYTARPLSGKLRKAFKDYSKTWFLNLKLLKHLMTEISNFAYDSIFFIRSASLEFWVNARGGLLRKKREFDRRVKLCDKLKLEEINIFGIALDVLKIKPCLHGNTACLKGVLKVGSPVLVVANHPYPPIDSFSIMDMIHTFRHDYSFIANANLTGYAEIASRIIPVDLSEGFMRTSDPISAKKSRFQCLRKCVDFLESKGGCLVIHPSGDIARAKSWGEEIVDTDWMDGIGFFVRRFAQKDEPLTILPIFIEGHMGNQENSQRCLNALMKSPSRTSAAIMYAVLHGPSSVNLVIGSPLYSADFKGMSEGGITSFLRKKVYENGGSPLIAAKA